MYLRTRGELLQNETDRPETIPGSYQTLEQAVQALDKGEIAADDVIYIWNVWDKPADIKEENHIFVRTVGAYAEQAYNNGSAKPKEYFHMFHSEDEAMMAYADGLIDMHDPIKVWKELEIDGVADVDDSHKTALRNITITADDGEVKQYQVPYSVGLKVEHGKRVKKGDPITDGALNPHDVLRISGVEAVQDYLTQGVLAVYRQQGVDINEKHIEVIIRQMMRKVRVEEPGDTKLLSGTVIDIYEFEDANAEVQARIDAGETDLKLATDSLILMGITKASLATESWLSAASFQETTKVLTDAAIKGKVDHLVGLKENVIIGKLIPAGAGLQAYRDFEPGITPESIVTEEMIDDEKM